VTDPHQLAIPGAIVTLTSQSSQHWTATTDLTGSGRLTGLAAGRYFIQTSAPGFEPSARAIELENNSKSDMAVTLGLAEVRSSIVVTASGSPQSTDEVSKSLTVVDSDTISRRTDRSIGEALTGLPGVREQQLGGPGSTTYFKIRGLRNADTAVLVDGLRLRDAAGTQ